MGDTLDEVSLLCADKRLMPTGREYARIGSAGSIEIVPLVKARLTAVAPLSGVGSRTAEAAA